MSDTIVSMDDLLFYVLDLLIFVMMLRWMKNSRKVVIPTKQGMQWLVPVIFVAVAVFGWFRYDGLFKYVQTAALLAFAVMYYFLKSGLSPEGIVINGALTTWGDAGSVTLSKKDNCVTIHNQKKVSSMYFDPSQLETIRKFLKERSVKASDTK
jgi:hypothetical protein